MKDLNNESEQGSFHLSEQSEKEQELERNQKNHQASTNAIAHALAYAAIVFEMAVCVVGGLLLGGALDRRFSTEPVLTLLCLTVGCVLGLVMMLRMFERLEAKKKNETPRT